MEGNQKKENYGEVQTDRYGERVSWADMHTLGYLLSEARENTMRMQDMQPTRPEEETILGERDRRKREILASSCEHESTHGRTTREIRRGL